MSKRDAELLLDHLRLDAHHWQIRLLLQHGQTFVASPLPPDVSVMKARCCYLNAYTLASENPDRFTYFEGFGSLVGGDGWPTAHAWCVDRDGRVVDPTWWGISQPPAAYHGIAVPLELAHPHAYEYSSGTLSSWRARGEDGTE